MNTRESRSRLIDEVKKFPVLYDVRHENHRDIDVRERCWAEIAARMGADSALLKREWKILRDSLRQALKKTREGVTTKAGLPVKKWQFQQKMSFLLPHMTKRPRPDYHFKMEMEEADPAEQPTEEAEDWQGREAEGEVATGGAGLDALELFFASVCASARRLSPALQRELKRQVLDSLLQVEAKAEAAGNETTANADSSKQSYDDEF